MGAVQTVERSKGVVGRGPGVWVLEGWGFGLGAGEKQQTTELNSLSKAEPFT